MLINNEEHNDLCVGIDLGTTNSVLATVNLKANGDIVSKVVDLPRAVDVYNSAAGKARLNTQKKPLLPSCVYYREEHGYEPLVGDFAKALQEVLSQYAPDRILIEPSGVGRLMRLWTKLRRRFRHVSCSTCCGRPAKFIARRLRMR